MITYSLQTMFKSQLNILNSTMEQVQSPLNANPKEDRTNQTLRKNTASSGSFFQKDFLEQSENKARKGAHHLLMHKNVVYCYTYSSHKHNFSRCIQNMGNCKDFQQMLTENYIKDTNFEKNKKKISTLACFQVLSGASKLQWSSCSATHDEHSVINGNDKVL